MTAPLVDPALGAPPPPLSPSDWAPLDPAVRVAVEDLYAEYAAALDDACTRPERLDDWLSLFADDASYLAIPRENEERGLPIGLIRCESRAMIADRVHAIRSISTFAPRLQRRIVTGLRIRLPRVDASFAIVESVGDDPPSVLVTGTYRDVLTEPVDGVHLPRFARKVAIYDAPTIPTSVIYPL